MPKISQFSKSDLRPSSQVFSFLYHNSLRFTRFAREAPGRRKILPHFPAYENMASMAFNRMYGGPSVGATYRYNAVHCTV